MISIVMIIIVPILIIMFIIIIMMMVMRMMNMMGIMMLYLAICQNVLQILVMATPEPKLRKSRDHLLLRGTLENDPPEDPI